MEQQNAPHMYIRVVRQMLFSYKNNNKLNKQNHAKLCKFTISFCSVSRFEKVS